MASAEMLEEFQKAFDNRHQKARELKEKGRRIMGWMCSYVPVELIHAAGFTPLRVIGGKEDTSHADAYLYINMCSLVRSVLEEAMQDKYSYLDGLITLNTCDNIRRLYDVWTHYLPPPFFRILSLPRKDTPEAVNFFRNQLHNLKSNLEEFSQNKINEEDLQRSIRLFNSIRKLQREIAETARGGKEILSGRDIFTVNLASGFLPAEEYLAMLQDMEQRLSPTATRRGEKNSGAASQESGIRLLVLGSELDNADLLSLIESCGARVVAEDLCTGSKTFWNPVDEDSPDSLEALAKAYLLRPPCPRMRMGQRRLEHLRRLIKDFSVQGVIHESIKFCKLYEEDYITIREEMKRAGVPLLSLSREYVLSGTGQYKTRLEAFIESHDK